MTTDEIIAQLGQAASIGNWRRVQLLATELRRLARDEGRAISGDGAVRLVEALAGGSPLGEHAVTQGATAIAEMRSLLARKPVNEGALRSSWTALYGLLADPAFDVDRFNVVAFRNLLGDLRAARQFDLLSKTADRMLARNPNDATTRRHYAQALIDEKQIKAGIELLESSLRAVDSGQMPATADEVAELRGLLGRANKQIYVEHVAGGSAPMPVRTRFASHLQAAIDSYAKAFNPSRPEHNYWHGINLVALLRLARTDGLSQIANPTDVQPEVLAKRIADALEPMAPSSNDAWLQATLAEAYVVCGDFEKATHCFGEYLKRKPDDFALQGTIRQLEEVYRVEAGAIGAGPILASLKEAQINRREGRFTLDSASLQAMKDYAGSAEHRRYSESMVPGGDYVGLKLLQTVVGRAQAVAAMCDESGATQGTGFIVRAGDLYPSWGDDLVVISNVHVVSCSKLPGFDPEAPLSPDKIRMVLEGMDGIVLECEKRARWQCSAGEHDACILTISNPEILKGRVTPLPISTPDTYLEPGDPDNPTSLNKAAKVSVIGYPKGGPLSLSVVGNVNGANGPLVDVGPRQSSDTDPVYLHYRAPTEPGNSGSPVFEAKSWTVVGLHHEGFDQFKGRPKLKGREGRTFANEGISIHSLRRAIKAKP